MQLPHKYFREQQHLGEAVARDVKGIGYGGVGYFAERKDVKILHIKKDDSFTSNFTS